MRDYAVVFEKSETGYSAYCPDLPGLASCGSDLKETKRMIREALDFHLESLLIHGEYVPEPTTIVETVATDIVETWKPALAKTA